MVRQVTEQSVRDIVLASLAEEIARRVAEKLLARQKKALVVYTGSLLSFDAALDSLVRLRQEGFTYHVLLTTNAARILDTGRIEAALAPETLAIGESDRPPELYAAPFDTILVPALTAHTAARLAACMADTAAARVILNSMMRGKNVVVSVDGCCPDNEERAQKGYRMTEALKARLRENLETIRSYGATLARAKSFDRATLRAIAPSWAQSPSRPAKPSYRHEGKVLSRTDVAALAPQSVLAVAPGCVITQLARDLAAERGIAIVET